MNERKITVAMVEAYDRKLKEDEHAAATREKYLRSVRAFAVWLDGAAVTKEAVTEWKAHLAERRQAPSTVNTALAALNGLFRFLGWEDCRARFLKVQRRIFRAPERELTRAEYDRLLAAAESIDDARLALLMESICATGIRVGEVKYLTVEAASQGRAEVSLKGKIRTILLPAKLCRKLLKYARKQKIAHGEIFLTTGGRSIEPAADMECNEAPMPKGGRRAVESVSAQSAPPVCYSVLSCVSRYCEARGYARPQLHRDDAHLSH